MIEPFVSVAVAPETIRKAYTGTTLAPVGNRGRIVCVMLAASLVAAVALPTAGADPGTAAVAVAAAAAKKKCKKGHKRAAGKKSKCRKRKQRPDGISGLSIAPTYVDFAALATGQMSAPEALTVTNTGNFPSGYLSTHIGAPNPADFPILSNFCERVKIPAGGSCTITASFAPVATGTRSVTLSVIGDGGGTDVSLLRGTGTP